MESLTRPQVIAIRKLYSNDPLTTTDYQLLRDVLEIALRRTKVSNRRSEGRKQRKFSMPEQRCQIAA